MADVKEAVSNVLKEIYSERELTNMGMKEGNPLYSLNLGYDAQSNQLEPIYYWILDFVENMGFKVEKITDNFMSSPGSGHFVEVTQKLSTIQSKLSEYMSGMNQITKSIIQLVYDLREWEIKLKNYDDLNSNDKDLRRAAKLTLKQMWLDKVDITKGNSSIKGMAMGKASFATLIDAFLVVEDEKLKNSSGDEIDLNERVKNVLRQRIKEFNDWINFSEKEQKKRFNIEKSYLKTQVETLKLYTKWARPYLTAVKKLQQTGFEKNPALLNTASTSLFELTLLAKKKDNALPDGVKDYNLKRDYNQCMVINFKYRGHVGQKVNQKGDYGFLAQGKMDMFFDAYALNSEELTLLDKELEKQDISDGLSFLEETTEDTLKQLEEDIEKFTSDEFSKKIDEEKKKKAVDKSNDINPFGALFGLFGSSKDKKKKDKKEISDSKDVQKDNFVEKKVRSSAADGAKDSLYTVYDIYKKAHRMASSPEAFDS